jgi:hypothetical protein
MTSKEKVVPFLTHILPLIDNLNSIEIDIIHQFIEIYDHDFENNNGFSQMVKNAMAQTRILDIRFGNKYLPL